MAALECITAARTGFLLAALHSVAERVNPRNARPPTPHCPRVLASAEGSPCAAAVRRARDCRAQLEPEHRVSRSFPPLGDMPRWLENGNGAADRGGGGVRCGLPANGDTT